MSLKSPVAFLALFPAALLAQAPAPPPRPAHVESAGGKSGGIAIEFSPRKLTDAERSPEGELKAILKATGTLKTERPIRYRATVLPAGTYPVRVSGGEPAGGRNFFFVIGTDTVSEGRTPEEKKEENGGASASPKSTGRASAAADERSGDGKAGKASAKLTSGENQPPARGSGARASAQASSLIKAIFHLGSVQKAGESVEFVVRPTARGDRFTLTVRAGSSQGKATLRFAE